MTTDHLDEMALRQIAATVRSRIAPSCATDLLASLEKSSLLKTVGASSLTSQRFYSEYDINSRSKPHLNVRF